MNRVAILATCIFTGAPESLRDCLSVHGIRNIFTEPKVRQTLALRGILPVTCHSAQRDLPRLPRLPHLAPSCPNLPQQIDPQPHGATAAWGDSSMGRSTLQNDPSRYLSYPRRLWPGPETRCARDSQRERNAL